MPTTVSLEMICGALFIGALTAYFAHKRQKNPYKWFFIGFFFGVLGLFAVFFSPSKKKKRRAPVHSEMQKIAPLVPLIRGPVDKFWYYLDPSHEQHGPISHTALTSAFKEGKISLSTYVWNEEMAEWKVLQDLTS